MLAGKKRGKRGGSIYMKTIMKRKISIPFNSLGSNLEDILKQQIIKPRALKRYFKRSLIIKVLR